MLYFTAKEHKEEILNSKVCCILIHINNLSYSYTHKQISKASQSVDDPADGHLDHLIDHHLESKT